jgi:putative two-component system response regulator
MPAQQVRPPTIVLIVEHDTQVRSSMVKMLTDAGYDCRDAANGADARQRLDAENDIVAVVCDLRMPTESGLDLVAALAADFPWIAVVITAAVDDPAGAALAFKTGAYGYLIKPFAPTEMLVTLAGALRRRELEAARLNQARELEQNVSRLKAWHRVLADIKTEPPGVPNSDEAGTIERLALAVSLRGGETGMHIERMSRMSAVLAKAVGFSDHSSEQVRLASALHDVGKIGVADTILLTPGALGPDERVAMQRHAQIGYQLLAASTSPLLMMAASIALAHHEWWDGGGYPRGLRGEEIPLEARIATVADVFDTLTSHGLDARALPIEAAVAAMTELRGRQFEPRLLDNFVASLDQIAAIKAAYPDRDDQPVIRVLVVDDHPIFVQSLVRLLNTQATITVVGAAGTAAEAEIAAVACEPDVILMDFELPDHDGATATEAIKVLIPQVKVVMLTGRTDQRALVRAIGAGCSGFVAKTEPIDKLLAAIQAAHEGETPTAIEELPRLLAQLRPTSRGLGSDLRPRELEVLQLMAAGMANKALAEQLFLSLNTVRNHVQHILSKLGVHSKLEAVATAAREGIIDRDELAAHR